MRRLVDYDVILKFDTLLAKKYNATSCRPSMTDS